MNKRKHKLERIIRFEYTLFNTLYYHNYIDRIY